MTDLLPSLSSDDENVAANSDDDEDSMCMDASFSLVGTNHSSIQEKSYSNFDVGWSFQSALDSVHQPQIPRMDIDAIISAKRKALLKTDKRNETSPSQDDNQDKNETNSDGSPSEGAEDSESETTSASDSDDDSNDNPSVKDSHLETLEDDILKTKTVSKKVKAGIDNPTVDHKYGDSSDDRKGEDEVDEEESSDSDDENDHLRMDEEERKEAVKANAFFDTKASMQASHSTNQGLTTVQVFNQLPLCRPLLRGIAAMGFVQPTPIQIAVIPLALNGRDICASAVTGSGKTAAFVLPIAERIIHRTTHNTHATRAIILTPTRELAAQCLGMLATLTSFANLRAALIVGGSKNVSAQAAELRTRPDFIVATPGRLLDHITNSVGFSLEDIEFLILDEADRLLDLGFSEEIMEIVKACPVVRQTLLFSATMNTKVDDLICLSLKNPVRVHITDQKHHNGTNMSSVGSSNNIEVAPRLEQEFVRIRASNEGVNREGALLALLTRTYKTQVICFFDTKAVAHRMMILAGLCGIRCAELHGNLTQPQRLQALEDFRCGNVDVLLATDLAARGLDIDRVQAVINFEMPSQLSTYVHRIGRTARAGRGGRSCTLIGEGRRHLMKELMKESFQNKKGSSDLQQSESTSLRSSGVVRTRAIPAAVIAHFASKILSLEPHYEEVLQAEMVARIDRLAEMEVTRAQNLIEHADEIKQRPQREWFASSAEKQRTTTEAAAASKKTDQQTASVSTDTTPSGLHRMTRKKRRAREAREALEQGRAEDTEENERPSKSSANSMKSDVRKQKRLQAELRHGTSGLSVHDVDVQEQRSQKRKKAKGTSSNDAVGDSNLFGEEKVSYSSPKGSSNVRLQEESVVRSSYKFIGYNPDKKLGRKKSHKAFKSKSKFKRR